MGFARVEIIMEWLHCLALDLDFGPSRELQFGGVSAAVLEIVFAQLTPFLAERLGNISSLEA